MNIPTSALTDPAEQIKNATGLANSLRGALKDSLLALEDNLWLQACQVWVGRQDEAWLRRISSGAQQPQDWVIAVYENAPRRTPPPLTNYTSTAKSIADCALSSLLIARMRDDPSGANGTSMLESLYRAAARWQPASKSTWIDAPPHDELLAEMRRALLTRGSHNGIHWAALGAVQRSHPGWEVAPVGDLIDLFTATEGRKWSNSVELNVMLDCGVGGGQVAKLTLRKRENGFGKMYRDPHTMSFLQFGEDFAAALANAWEYTKSSGVAVGDCDVTWRLTSLTPDALGAPGERERLPDYVRGASAGAGFALGLKYLLDPTLSPRALEHWAVTGSVTPRGDIGRVAVSRNKLQAVASEKKLKALVPVANYTALKSEWAGRIQTLEGASTVEDAHNIIQKEEDRARQEEQTRILEEQNRILLARNQKILKRAAAALTILLVFASTGWWLAHARGEELQAQKGEIEGLYAQLEVKNKSLEGTNADLEVKKQNLETTNADLTVTQDKLVAANREVSLERDEKEQQRQAAEAARRQEEEQRKRAEGLQREADRQKDVAQAYRQIAVATQLGVQAENSLSRGNATVARMLYAKALTFDDRPDLRSGYLAAKSKGGYKLLWQSFDKGDDEDGLGALALSPDGKLVADGGDSDVRILDAKDGSLIATLMGHTAVVAGASFSPDGRHLATGSADGTLKIWDVASKGNPYTVVFRIGERASAPSTPQGSEAAPEDDEREFVESVAYSPDGQRLLVGTSSFYGGTVRVLATATYSVIHTRNTAAPVNNVAFNRDGRFAASDLSGRVLFWRNKDDFSQVVRFKHSPFASSVAFAGDHLISAGGASVRAWNLSTENAEWEIASPAGALASLAVSSDGQRLATGGSDQSLRLWDTRTRRELVHFGGFQGAVTRIRFGANNQLAVRAKNSKQVSYWGVDPKSPDFHGLTGISGFAGNVTFSPDGKWIAALDSKGGTVHIWDRKTGNAFRVIDNESAEINSITFSPDGRWLFTGGIDDDVHLVEVETGKERTLKYEGREPSATHTTAKKYFTDAGSGMEVGAFSPDGNLLGTNGFDAGTVFLWDFKAGRVVRVLQAGVDETASNGGCGEVSMFPDTLVFSPDGKHIAAAGRGSSIFVWNVDGGEPIAKFDQCDLTLGLAFSPDGRYLASGGLGSSLRLWSLPPKRGRFALGRGNEPVTSVAFSPDGKLLTWATGYARKVRVWDMEEEKELGALQDCGTATLSVAFSHDGQSIATTCEDGMVYVREVQTLESAYKAPPADLLSGAQSEANLTLKEEGDYFGGELFPAKKLNAVLGAGRNAHMSLTSQLTAANDNVLNLGLFSLYSESLFRHSCLNFPSKAELNTFPLTFRSPAALCANYPPLQLRLAKGGTYPQTEEEWKQGIRARVGDEIYALIYISNVAANNYPLLPGATARNVLVRTSLDSRVGLEHHVSVAFKGDNTNTVLASLPVKLGANEYLEVVPNSGQLFDYKGRAIMDSQGFQLGNSTVRLGDLDPGFETDVFLRFRIRVKTKRP